MPPNLPPDPAIELLPLQNKLVRAGKALGSLNAVSDALPDSGLLLYYYVRKEAVLSSQIEGTQSSLSDLLLYESKEVPSTPLDDVAEVSSYVAALQHGLLRIQDGFPLSLRLIREMHEILLSHGRGHTMNPGEFRQSQNWIGGSRPGNAKFVPPPPEHLMGCLDTQWPKALFQTSARALIFEGCLVRNHYSGRPQSEGIILIRLFIPFRAHRFCIECNLTRVQLVQVEPRGKACLDRT